MCALEPINCTNTDTNAVMSLLKVCIVTLLNNIDSRVKTAKNVNKTRDKSFCQTYAKVYICSLTEKQCSQNEASLKQGIYLINNLPYQLSR